MHTITGATALLGPALRATAGAVVLIEDEMIRAAGTAAEVDVPPKASPYDARNLVLLPGFIDAHVHIGLARPADVVSGGVTTVRDLGWPAERIFPLARRSRAAGTAGPTIFAAGAMLTVRDGYPQRAAWAPPGTGLPVEDAGGPERAVELMRKAGACVIKVALNAQVGPTLDRAQLRAIADSAHGSRLAVTAHVWGLGELEKALDAGIDELAHMLMSPEELPDELLARMVSQGMRVVPTLSIFSGRALRIAIDNLERFRSAGGEVIYGTDLGNQGPRPGIEIKEVRAMKRAGFSQSEVVHAATIGAARSLGLARAGVIAPGYDADLVLVEGDAVERTEALCSVIEVWRRGRRVAGRARSAGLVRVDRDDLDA